MHLTIFMNAYFTKINVELTAAPTCSLGYVRAFGEQRSGCSMLLNSSLSYARTLFKGHPERPGHVCPVRFEFFVLIH